MLGFISIALMYVGFVTAALGEFRKNRTARIVGLVLLVPAFLLSVALFVGELGVF